MDRSEFPNGVPLTGSDLQFESESRRKDYQRVFKDGMQPGVLSGFGVTVNGINPTKIDIAPGSGYVGDVDAGNKVGSKFGSYIHLDIIKTLDAPAGGWIVGEKYYVNAVYVESPTIQRPNLDGTSLETVRTEVSSPPNFEIITVSNYLALSDEEKHKRLKLAKIIPSGSSLSASDITLPWKIERVKTAEGLTNITGVTVAFVSSTAVDGDSSLDWNATGSQLRWKDAGDGSYGSWVSITGDGRYTLPSSNASKYIEVDVVFALLPSSNQTDTLVISDLFEGELRPVSGADRLLRSYGGSALKTRTNPLGLSLQDLPGGTQDIKGHRVYMHDDGLVGKSTLLQMLVVHSGAEDYIQFTAPSGSDAFFVKGNAYTAISESENPLNPGDKYTIKFDDYAIDNFSLFQVYVDELAKLRRNQVAKLSVNQSPDVEGVVILDVEFDSSLSSFIIDYDYVDTSERRIRLNNGSWYELNPGYDGLYELVDETNRNKIVIWIDFSALPNSDAQDTWSVLSLPLTENVIPLGNVCYLAGNIYGWNADWGSGGSVWDTRVFGTLGVKNIRNDLREYIDKDRTNIFNNGVYYGFSSSGVGGSALTVESGKALVEGKDVVVSSSTNIDVSTLADGDYFVWVDNFGNVELVKKPEDDSSNVLEEALRDYMQRRAVVSQVTVTGGSISSIVDKRAFVGIGKPAIKSASENLSPQFPDILIRKRPDFPSGMLMRIDNEFYILANLKYDESTGLWMLEDNNKDGVALVLRDAVSNENVLNLLKLKAGDGSTASLRESFWPTYYTDFFVSGFRKMFGDGRDGDLVVDSPTDLGTDRIKQFRNLTLNNTLTCDGPYLIIAVEDTLTINSGGLIDMRGQDGVDSVTFPGAGGVGKGGKGGDGVARNHGLGGRSYGGDGPVLVPNPFARDGLNGSGGGAGGNAQFPLSLAGGGGGGGGAGATTSSNRTGGGGGGGGLGGNGGAAEGIPGGAGRNTMIYNFDLSFETGDFQNFPAIFKGGVYGWGGGGGSGASFAEYGSGGGGAGGGSVYIEARHIVIDTAGIRINCKGGNGGTSSAFVSTGGSGGGGGGFVLVVCGDCDKNDINVLSAIDVSGGIGSDPKAGAKGGDGGSGFKGIINFSNLGKYNF